MVDGHLSNMIYLRSLDVTYNGLLEVMGERSSACFDFLLFHSPYNKACCYRALGPGSRSRGLSARDLGTPLLLGT